MAIALVFTLMAAILFVELRGIQVNYTERVLDLLPQENVVTKAEACAGLTIDTCLIWDSSDDTSIDAMKDFPVILADMKVGYESVDLEKEALPDFDKYSVVIVLLSDLAPMGQGVDALSDWVYHGGNALFALTLPQSPYTDSTNNMLGIRSDGNLTRVDDIYLFDGFMLGGGKAYHITDGYDSARTVQLFSDKTQVYAAEGSAQGVPLIWESTFGRGKCVVDNFGICDKAVRGFYAASLSLLKEVYVYPVINGSTFYLDDFPSQIPGGANEYITRDYNTSVRDFYLNIWWPDMMNIADRYNIKYTGLAIESYDNMVDGNTGPAADKNTFIQLGNMLLRMGGELGYHGYNHQPLVLGNRSYEGVYDYKTWVSNEAMTKAFKVLADFCEALFPNVEFAVYVPPSNLLSQEGKQMLLEKFPQIRTFSGIYMTDGVLDFALVQEFDVDKNGIVEQPRIISGCVIDDYMTVAALSELNMHLVNNHFTHPDDALDPERGADLGWETLTKRFESYLSWLYASAPGLRNMTGTELSAAVQRFVAVTPHMQQQDDRMTLSMDHFYDNAQFLIRFNEKQPDQIQGGTLKHMTGDLYLLEAMEETVTITYKQEKT